MSIETVLKTTVKVKSTDSKRLSVDIDGNKDEESKELETFLNILYKDRHISFASGMNLEVSLRFPDPLHFSYKQPIRITSIALHLLAVQGVIPVDTIFENFIACELTLGGDTRPIRGLYDFVRSAIDEGYKTVIVAAEQYTEAMFAADNKIRIVVLNNFDEILSHHKKELKEYPFIAQSLPPSLEDCYYEYEKRTFEDVKGFTFAKKACLLAALTRFPIMFEMSRPNLGATMLASRINSILPPMTIAERHEATRVYSLLGILSKDVPYVDKRPFRAPHHTVSQAGLFGKGYVGDKRNVHPGEVSLAHAGVLFLDELPEFNSGIKTALRRQMRFDVIEMTTGNKTHTFPARVLYAASCLSPEAFENMTESYRIRQRKALEALRDMFPIWIKLDAKMKREKDSLTHAKMKSLVELSVPSAYEQTLARMNNTVRHLTFQMTKNAEVVLRIADALSFIRGEAEPILLEDVEEALTFSPHNKITE